MRRSHQVLGIKAMMAFTCVAILAGCGPDHVASVGEKVVYQRVEVPVPRPCPVKQPVRPGDAKTHGLARPLPTDPAALVDILLAKLKEWDGPGKYGDQAEAAIATCTKP